MSKTATVHAQQRWEYMELTRKTEGYLVNELNELGQAGWELVSVSFHKDTKSGLGAALAWTAFLKRPHSGHAQPAPIPENVATATPQASEEAPKAAADETPEIFNFKS